MEEQDNRVEMSIEQIYFDEISKYPLLTAAEELELGKLVAEGTEEEKSAATKKFTESNLRLVVALASKYTGMGVPLLDLIQEGNIGLMMAIDKYDYTLGFRFSTYAKHWILKEIRDVVSCVDNNLLSIDATFKDDDDGKLSDILGDEKLSTPEQEIEAKLLHEELLKSLDILDEKQKRVIILRSGIGGEKVHTLEEVAKELNISKEGVRYTEFSAMKKLKDNCNLSNLKDYLQ